MVLQGCESMVCPLQLSCRVGELVVVAVAVAVGATVGTLLVGVLVLMDGDGTVFKCTGGYVLTFSGTIVMLAIVSGSVPLPCVK